MTQSLPTDGVSRHEVAVAHAARPPRAGLWIALAAGVLITGVALKVSWRHETITQPAAPYTVTDSAVEVTTGAPTWHYISLAQAALSDPISPEPVPGRVAFDEGRAQPVVAPLQGHVDTVAVRLGQRVQQGERLVAIRSAALVDLQREIELLQAKEAARGKAVERVRALVQLKASPEKERVSAEQDLRQAQLAREAAELKLRSVPVVAGADGLYWITASRAGVVVERTVLVGQEVGPDRSDPLLVVGELDEVIVTADLPEHAVTEVRVGQPAHVTSSAAPGRELSGRVEYVGEVVDPVKRMVNVRIRVDNQERTLRPNAFVQVAFVAEGQARIVVPAEAVVSDGEESFVFVQAAARPQRLERRHVVPGRTREGQVEIASGLQPGETFVAKGALLLLNAIDLAQ